MLPITIVIECTNSEDMQRAIRQAALGQSLVYLIIFSNSKLVKNYFHIESRPESL